MELYAVEIYTLFKSKKLISQYIICDTKNVAQSILDRSLKEYDKPKEQIPNGMNVTWKIQMNESNNSYLYMSLSKIHVISETDFNIINNKFN